MSIDTSAKQPDPPPPPPPPDKVEEPIDANTWDETPHPTDTEPTSIDGADHSPAEIDAATPQPPSLDTVDEPVGADTWDETRQPPDSTQTMADDGTEDQSAPEQADVDDTTADERDDRERDDRERDDRERDDQERDDQERKPQEPTGTPTGLPANASITEPLHWREKQAAADVENSNAYVYGTDSLGRVNLIYAENLELGKGERTPSEMTLARSLGKTGDHADHAGHGLASRFMGSDSSWNLTPQDSNLNQGVWNQMETVWAKAIQAGQQVGVEITANYVGQELRPTSYDVRYWYDGKLQPTVLYLNRPRG